MNQNIHQGDLVAKPGTVYHFKEITGYLDASGADTKTAFPKLTVGRRTPRERLAEAFKLGYAKGRRASQEL